MVAQLRKSMDGVRTRTPKRTSTPRSFHDERDSKIIQPSPEKKLPRRSRLVVAKRNQTPTTNTEVEHKDTYQDYVPQKNNIGIISSTFQRKLIWFFTHVLITLVLLWWFGNFFEKTLVTIQPHIEYRNVDEYITLHKNPKDNQLGFDIIAITDSLSVPVDAYGLRDNAELARGLVTIFNTSDTDRAVQSLTQLKSEDGYIFELGNSDVLVPAKSEDSPGSVDVEVVAINHGDEYNIQPGEFRFIDGDQEHQEYNNELSVRSFQEFSGGAKGLIPLVSETEYINAETYAQKLLADKLMQRLDFEKTDEFIVVQNSQKIIFKNSQVYFDEHEESMLKIDGMIFGLLVGNNNIAEYLLTQHIIPPEEHNFSIVNPEMLNVDIGQNSFNFEKDKNINAHISGRPLLESTINEGFIKDSIRSQDMNFIHGFIENNPLFDYALVQVRPFWRGYASSMDDNIIISIRH